MSDNESTEITVYASMNTIDTGAPRIAFCGRDIQIWPTGSRRTGLVPFYSMSLKDWITLVKLSFEEITHANLDLDPSIEEIITEAVNTLRRTEASS